MTTFLLAIVAMTLWYIDGRCVDIAQELKRMNDREGKK